MAVKVQVTTSVGLTYLASVGVLPVEPYTVPLELLHAYDTVGVSPSASMAFRTSGRLAVTTTIWRNTGAIKLGAVLVTVADALLVAVAFKESVNVATQVKSALGAELLDDKVD